MKPLLLAIASALLTVLVFPNFSMVFLAPMCLTPIMIACAWEPDARKRVRLGLAAGVVYWCGVCYWIFAVLANYAGISGPVAWLTFVLFGIGKSIHWALFAWLAGYAVRSAFAIPILAALWTGIERTNAIDFSWLVLGNAGIDMELPMRLAPITGVYGVSFVLAMMNAAIALLVLRRPRKHLAWLLALGTLYVLPELPPGEEARHTAIAIQPNIEERSDWTRALTETTVRSLALMSLEQATESKTSPEVILWPEVPAPFYYEDNMFRDQAEQLARVTKSSFLFGAVGHTPKGEPLNSAYMVGPDGNYVARYDKVNLVPFGEFVPPIFWWINKISSEAGSFAPGEKVVVFPARGGRIGAFICYESVFPHFVRQFVAAGAGLLVNLSNDGYFGKSAAREQHLLLVRMRAAENNRWIIRATNDGISAAIDNAGRLVAKQHPYRRSSSRIRFAYTNALTPYTRHGDWFVWGCLVLGIAASLAASQFTSSTVRDL